MTVPFSKKECSEEDEEKGKESWILALGSQLCGIALCLVHSQLLGAHSSAGRAQSIPNVQNSLGLEYCSTTDLTRQTIHTVTEMFHESLTIGSTRDHSLLTATCMHKISLSFCMLRHLYGALNESLGGACSPNPVKQSLSVYKLGMG